jgi:lysozyme
LDTDFQQNWQGIASAGLIRGAYQYFEPGEDPTTQANIMINAIGAAGPGDLPPVLDLETTGGQSAATIQANLKTWISDVETATGYTPMIYYVAKLLGW